MLGVAWRLTLPSQTFSASDRALSVTYRFATAARSVMLFCMYAMTPPQTQAAWDQ